MSVVAIMSWWPMLLAGVAAVVIIVASAWLLSGVYKQWHIATLRRRCIGKLVLTYDDGPGAHLTPALLHELAARGARATFFLVGFRAQRFPEECDRIAAAGHEIACHTHDHLRARMTTPRRSLADMRRGYHSLRRWIHADAPFRPPFGKITPWLLIEASRRRLPVCFWTHDGCDTRAALPAPAAVVDAVRISRGGVVLLHSHDRGSDRHEYVLDLTRQLLELARREQYVVCTMSTVLDRRDAHRPRTRARATRGEPARPLMEDNAHAN